MAPSSQRQANAEGHDPPPSTIAAQILRTGAAATTTQNNTSSTRNGLQREVFDTLLAEFLADPYVDPSEDKLDDNARFVTFLAEAAAEARSRQIRDNPFGTVVATTDVAPVVTTTTLEKQAADCLRAVKMTLEQQPDLLVWNGTDVKKEGTNPPFVCWVIAKVLAVGAREKMGEVWDNAIQVLVTCERSLQNRPAMWRTASLISKLLKATADSLAAELAAHADAQENKSVIMVSVPPATSIAELWGPAQISLVLPPGYQVSPKKANDASNMLLLVLCAVHEAVTSDSGTMMWLLDHLHEVLQVYRVLEKQRCLDRRRIVVCLSKILADLVEAPLRRSELQRACDVLAQLLICVSPTDGEETQRALTKSIIHISHFTSERNSCIFHLSIVLPMLKQQFSSWPNLLQEFKKAVDDALDVANLSGPPTASQLAQDSSPEKSDTAKSAPVSNGTGDQAREAPSKRPLDGDTSVPEHMQKRRRISGDAEDGDRYTRMITHCNRLLNPADPGSYKDLGSRLPNLHVPASDENIKQFIQALRFIPCEGTSSLQEHNSKDRRWTSCMVCDARSINRRALTGKWTSEDGIHERRTYHKLLNLLIVAPNLKTSRELRILVAQLLRRFVNHTTDIQYLDLAHDPLGRWCMRSYQSSFRELRICSVQALMPYLRSDINEETMYRNRSIVLELLLKLSTRENLGLQDTFIFTWGQIGRVCGETELNIALIELVNSLGHGHMIICAAAFQEIRLLARELKKTLSDLFAPFWRSVAPEVVKDVISCPQKAQQLSDLLQLRGGVDELLVSTQTETVPFLVLTKRYDVLQRITQARPDIDSVEALIMQPRRNMACVIAKLLLEFGSESGASAHLQDAAPALKGKFADLIQVDPVSAMCEVLKSTVDHGESAQSKSKKAFELVAKIAMANSLDSNEPYLQAFLEEYVLGIMAHFTDIVDNSKDRQSVSDKRRALKAIEELIKRSGILIELALPQVRATLHSALENPELASQAFSAWMALMDCIEPENFQSYMPHSFAIVVQKWKDFDSGTQTRAHKMITHLVERNNSTITDELAWMPSLAGIDLFQKLEGELAVRKESVDIGKFLDAFATRCSSDTGIVVRQALRELVPYLASHQSQVLESKAEAIPKIYRALLDASIRFKEHDDEVVDLCARSLGLLGCVDPNNTETICVKHNLMVLSNFERVQEVVEFITHMLSEVLVPAFQAAPTGKQQSYLAFVMQELLRISGITEALSPRARGSTPRQAIASWLKLPETTQYVLAPYLSSKYALTNPVAATDLLPFMPEGPTPPHAVWLRNLVFQLLHRAKGTFANLIFPRISRVVQGHDISIAAFMLPFVIQNVVADGTDQEIEFITSEVQSIMEYDIRGCPEQDVENVKKSSENVFEIFDYLSRWVHEKNELCTKYNSKSRNVVVPDDFDVMKETMQISKAQQVLDSVPAWNLARRASECGLAARAVYHNEQHIRAIGGRNVEADYKDLQHTYEQINEPDAIEGISTKLKLLDVSQQVLDHKKAGRWTAALSHYELAVRKQPENVALHTDMLYCLHASGQYDSLIKTFETSCSRSANLATACRPMAVEAAWKIGSWTTLERLLVSSRTSQTQDFEIGVGQALLALQKGDSDTFHENIATLRANTSRSMTRSSIMSLSTSHDHLLKLHVLCELEAISGFGSSSVDNKAIIHTMNERLDKIGSFTDDKQYVLGVRRAAMALSKLHTLKFTDRDISAAWLTSCRLARKGGQTNAAYDAVMRASDLKDPAATIEHARLLWKDGNIRKAVQNLRSAINDGSFATSAEDNNAEQTALITAHGASRNKLSAQNMLLAKTQLLLAKWMDIGGQEKSVDVLKFYKNSTDIYNKWDKGHYFLGSYYNKILESEKSAPASRQSEAYLTGECAKLTIDNYLRSMLFGPKYLYRTLPKVLTLWLDFGQDLFTKQKEMTTTSRGGRGKPKQVEPDKYYQQRVKMMELINVQVEKYLLKRTPTYISFTAYAQLLSRIDSPMASVSKLLKELITYITTAHPRQALWSLLAVSRSQSAVKSTPARAILQAVHQKPNQHVDLKSLVRSAEALTECLLDVCKQPLEAKGQLSLIKDVKFRRRLDDPCGIVVPFQKTLQATLASVPGVQAMRKNIAFPHESVTIAGFFDEVMVLSSLQKPRKLIIRGADGNKYPILCKPKDDLRKDQRLMEFNAMIDRALKRDVDAAKRKLYIKTYAVTTLNDEHGVLEWVDGLKPLRDIILGLLRRQGVHLNFNDIRSLLDRGCVDVLNTGYKFLESFLEPEDWFHARMRYTRSCAVMSIVGHALGLGDRHGENISLEQGSGGVFHVDFNCLFEKGLTFDKPELVPFRLTHNMVDAFGVYGYEGPFRRAAEITQRILKQFEDTLMTIMESFIYDPTTDFGLEPRRHRILGVPETPAEVLLNVKGKFNCMLRGETVPLSVEGYVDALVRTAVDPRCLVQMYVGWCAFL